MLFKMFLGDTLIFLCVDVCAQHIMTGVHMSVCLCTSHYVLVQVQARGVWQEIPETDQIP